MHFMNIFLLYLQGDMKKDTSIGIIQAFTKVRTPWRDYS